MTEDTVETIDINPSLRVRIEPDQDADSPAEWDNVGQIAYLAKSRYFLGTEKVSVDRMHEIDEGIESGKLIGLPVYAYVHSGSTIATKPFSCAWDSGRSGWVYCTREKAIAEFGKKLLTKKVREAALKCLQGEVETFAQYLEGDVYGYIVERVIRDEDGEEIDTEELDSCWGMYGLDYAKEQGKAQAEWQVAQDAKEAVEVAYWAARDVETKGARA